MNKLTMKSFKVFTVIAITLSINTVFFAQNAKNDNSMPKWLKEHMEYMTKGTGRWITDNSEFKSENEPFDEYGTEWKWGIGKNGITGRLFGLKDNKEVGDFWTFNLFWHPEERKVILQQFGGAGVLGIGEMQSIETDGTTERMTRMAFYTTDGTKWKDLHKIVEEKDSHQTTSFILKDESWSKQRSYVWKRESN